MLEQNFSKYEYAMFFLISLEVYVLLFAWKTPIASLIPSFALCVTHPVVWLNIITTTRAICGIY